MMKVAVTYEDGQVFQHFGHCREFKIYETGSDGVISSRICGTGESGHGALAGVLKEQGVDILICGGIGAGARAALDEQGIRLYPGVTGDADKSVDALLAGSLEFDPDTSCSHHHGEGHTCGSHHCEEDKQGCAGNHTASQPLSE